MSTQDRSSVRPRASRAPLFLLATAVLLAVPVSTLAQGIEKEPRGPGVSPVMMGFAVVRGALVEWRIPITNNFPVPTTLSFIDEPQMFECGGMETAPQEVMFFEDDGSGTCNANVSVINGGTPTIDCDITTQRLEITGISVPPMETATVVFFTRIDEMATPNEATCNRGRFVTQGGQELPTIEPGSGDPCTCLTIQDSGGAAFEARKSADTSDGPLIPGDDTRTVLYEIAVENTGEGPWMGLTINDTLPAGLEFVPPVITCPPEATCTIDGTNTNLTVTGIDIDEMETDIVRVRATATCAAATDDDSGFVCNQASIPVPGAPGVSVNTDDPAQPGLEDPTCVPVHYSNLTQSTKELESWDDTDGDGEIDVGERLRFRITARNDGRIPAESVIITDDLAFTACLDPVTATAEDGGSVVGGIATWMVGDIAPGAAVVVHFTAALTLDGTCCNQAEFSSMERTRCGLLPIFSDDPGTPTADGDATCVSPGPQPRLEISKDWTCVGTCEDPPAIDDIVMWTVTIENTGTAAATGATFIDEMPVCLQRFVPPVTIDSNQPANGVGTDMSIPSNELLPPSPGTVIVEDLGGTDGVQPGEIITITWETTFRFEALNCCNQGRVEYAESSAPALSDDPQTPGQPLDETCPNRPEPISATLAKPLDFDPFGQITNYVDNDGTGDPTVGDTVLYTLVFTNTGATTLNNVHIEDIATDHDCVSFDIAGAVLTVTGGDPTNPRIDVASAPDLIVDIDSIDPAEEVTITFEGTITVDGPFDDCCNQASWTADEIAPETRLSDEEPVTPQSLEASCFDVAEIIIPNEELTVTKELVNVGCVVAGGTAVWRVTVENTGVDDVATWWLDDILPPTFTNPMPVMGADPAVCVEMNMAGDWRLFFDDTCPGYGTIPVGESRVFEYQADVPCEETGTFMNTVAVNWTTGVDLDSASVDWGVPDLQVAKSWEWTDTNGSGGAEPGEPVTFVISITNPPGGCEATDVVVTDDLDMAELNFGTFMSANCGFAAPTVTCDNGTDARLALISAGETVELRFTIEVETPPDMAPDINNVATVTPATCDPAFDVVRAGDTATGPTGDLPWGGDIVAPTMELIWNHEATRNNALPGAGADSLRGAVFLGDTPNTVCANTNVTASGDVVPQVVDPAALAAGVVAAGNTDGEVVYFEVREYCSCDSNEPPAGMDPDYLDYIVVTHDGAGAYTVTTLPGTGGSCP